jgi:hypothetical protein
MRTKYKPTVATTLDPQIWMREFRTWVQSEIVPIGEYLSALEHRCYILWIRDSPASQLAQIRLAEPELTELKRQIARRVHQAGGEFRTNAVTVRSADGLTFTVHLPEG